MWNSETYLQKIYREVPYKNLNETNEDTRDDADFVYARFVLAKLIRECLQAALQATSSNNDSQEDSLRSTHFTQHFRATRAIAEPETFVVNYKTGSHVFPNAPLPEHRSLGILQRVTQEEVEEFAKRMHKIKDDTVRIRRIIDFYVNRWNDAYVSFNNIDRDKQQIEFTLTPKDLQPADVTRIEIRTLFVPDYGYFVNSQFPEIRDISREEIKNPNIIKNRIKEVCEELGINTFLVYVDDEELIQVTTPPKKNASHDPPSPS